MTWFFNKSPTLFERLFEEKKRLELRLVQSKPDSARNELLQKIRHLDTARHIDEWLSSPGLRPPV